MCNKGITQFYLPPTYEPYLPSRKASPPFGWYSFRLPTKGWPGWVDLGGWTHTEINVPHRELNPDTVTHLSTNRPRRWLTSLIEANALTTTPDHQLGLTERPKGDWRVGCRWDRTCRCYGVVSYDVIRGMTRMWISTELTTIPSCLYRAPQHTPQATLTILNLALS